MSDFHRSTNFWVGLDVHKDSVTAAVFRNRDRDPMCVDRMLYDLKKIRRYFKRLEAVGIVRACYEASGAGYVLQRSLTEWPIERQSRELVNSNDLVRRSVAKLCRFGARRAEKSTD